MTGSRQLHLGAFMRPVGIHTAWWRYPGAYPDANFNLKHLIRFAQTLERGRFDAWFMADHLAVLNMPMAALKRSATVTSFDPLTLLPALAMVTEHLGLIATASSTFEPAYMIARRFASLDHISGGRAGWNLVGALGMCWQGRCCRQQKATQQRPQPIKSRHFPSPEFVRPEFSGAQGRNKAC